MTNKEMVGRIRERIANADPWGIVWFVFVITLMLGGFRLIGSVIFASGDIECYYTDTFSSSYRLRASIDWRGDRTLGTSDDYYLIKNELISYGNICGE